MLLIVSLKNCINRDVKSVGNKAYNLSVLYNNGINIPNAIVCYIKMTDDSIVKLKEWLNHDCQYAIRSSMPNEDSIDLSSGGKYETEIPISGNNVIYSLVEMFSIDNQNRNISYIIQELIPADVSGVIFTKHPLKNTNEMIINCYLGAGEMVVSGKLNPEEYRINLENNSIKKKIIDKYYIYSYGESRIGETKEMNAIQTRCVLSNDYKILSSVYFKHRKKQVMTDQQIHELVIESKKIRTLFNDIEQDIEFSFFQQQLYILQARPITSLTNNEDIIVDIIENDNHFIGNICSTGTTEADVIVINDNEQISQSSGKIIVAYELMPEYMYNHKNIKGIITVKGGLLSHAAIVAREMKIPCLVGCDESILTELVGKHVILNGNEGFVEIMEGYHDK